MVPILNESEHYTLYSYILFIHLFIYMYRATICFNSTFSITAITITKP